MTSWKNKAVSSILIHKIYYVPFKIHLKLKAVSNCVPRLIVFVHFLEDFTWTKIVFE